MVDGDEVLGVDLDAHLDAQIVDVVDVPGARVTHDVAVLGLGEQRTLPERLRQRLEAQRREEPLAVAHHLALVDAAAAQDLGQVETGIAGPRRNEVVDVAPALAPHVAEQVRRDRPVRRDHVDPVTFAELGAHVAVQRVVQRANLVP